MLLQRGSITASNVSTADSRSGNGLTRLVTSKAHSTAAWETSDVALNLGCTALVVIDPQIDFMSPEGRCWDVVGESVLEQNLVPNLMRLFAAAKEAGITVAVSPHHCTKQDRDVQSPFEIFKHVLGMNCRGRRIATEKVRDAGAGFLPQFKPFIEDGRTIICSAHTLHGPQICDLVLQLSKHRVNGAASENGKYCPVRPFPYR